MAVTKKFNIIDHKEGIEQAINIAKKFGFPNLEDQYPFNLCLQYISEIEEFRLIQAENAKIDHLAMKDVIELKDILLTANEYFEQHTDLPKDSFKEKLAIVINRYAHKDTKPESYEFGRNIFFELKVFRFLIKCGVKPILFSNESIDIEFDCDEYKYGIECERKTSPIHIEKSVRKLNNDLRGKRHVGILFFDVSGIVEKDWEGNFSKNPEVSIENEITKFWEEKKEFWQVGNLGRNNNFHQFDNVKMIGVTIDTCVFQIEEDGSICPINVFRTHLLNRIHDNEYIKHLDILSPYLEVGSTR